MNKIMCECCGSQIKRDEKYIRVVYNTLDRRQSWSSTDYFHAKCDVAVRKEHQTKN